MVEYGSVERHPFRSLLVLLLLVLAGAIVFTMVGFGLSAVIYGFKPLLDQSAEDPLYIESLKIVQIFSSFGMFVLPAVYFAHQESGNWRAYLRLSRITILTAVLSVLVLFAYSAFLDLSGTFNQGLKLPEWLRGLEEWMLQQEKQMEVLTKQLLIMNGPGPLLLNLLMLAVIPAVGEEFIFRGCLQRIFHEWTRNHHIAIWVTAIIFSAIHFQFYGFIPRMLLGALFGYLLVWSGSIWPAIIGHFVNNAAAVITAYVYQRQGKSLDKLTEPDPLNWYAYLISFIAGSLLLWYFYKSTSDQNTNNLSTDGSRLD